MNDPLQLALLVGMAALSIVVLGLRAVRPMVMPWWAVFLIVIGLGWALVIISAIAEGPGSGLPLAVVFGWMISLFWFSPWLIVYAVIRLFFQVRQALLMPNNAMQRTRDKAESDGTSKVASR
jgi:hypothetical protein